MHQLTQKLKDGKMQVLEVPVPVVGPGQVLIRTHYSLISAGTEGSTVQTARKGLIGKARERFRRSGRSSILLPPRVW
jgi:threonine dehydrogenase-like Zn-dependent dehydrogenase